MKRITIQQSYCHEGSICLYSLKWLSKNVSIDRFHGWVFNPLLTSIKISFPKLAPHISKTCSHKCRSIRNLSCNQGSGMDSINKIEHAQISRTQFSWSHESFRNIVENDERKILLGKWWRTASIAFVIVDALVRFFSIIKSRALSKSPLYMCALTIELENSHVEFFSSNMSNCTNSFKLKKYNCFGIHLSKTIRMQCINIHEMKVYYSTWMWLF